MIVYVYDKYSKLRVGVEKDVAMITSDDEYWYLVTDKDSDIEYMKITIPVQKRNYCIVVYGV